MDDLFGKINQLDEQEQKAQIEKASLLRQALQSNNVDLIHKANNYIGGVNKDNGQAKSILIDPQSLNVGLGYLEKTHFHLSYDILRNMSKIPLIRAIINTRIEQVASFSRPQQDKYSPGFVIRPKKYGINTDGSIKLTKEQEREIGEITEFILWCGRGANVWHGDDFEKFIRKLVNDSLSLDQGCFEVIRNKLQNITEFLVVDGATIRIAESYDSHAYEQKLNPKYDQKMGYYPAYVQIYLGKVVAEFYPWELCFGIRNPQVSIYANGYGRSELEDLIQIVTSILNADAYNANYFKVGSNPKGILKVTGNVNPTRIEEFRAQWQAQMAGVRNCLHPDTLIWTKQFGGQEIENVIRGKDNQSVTIWTGTNWQAAKIFKTEEKNVSITHLNNGIEIKTSPEHRFGIVNNNGDFEWVEQNKLKAGNFVCVNKQSYFNYKTEDYIDYTDRIPQYKNQRLTEELVEILGWSIGDGSLFFRNWNRITRNSSAELLLYFHYSKELEIMNRYVNILTSFGLKPQIVESVLTEEQREKAKRKYKFKTVSSKHFAVQLFSVDFVWFLINELGFTTSTQGKVIPEFIFKLPESYRAAFLRGLFSADGNKEGECGARLSIQSDNLRKQVRNLLLSVGVRTTNCEKSKPEFCFNVKTVPKFLDIRDKDVFANKIGFLQPHKQPTKSIQLGKQNFPVSVVVKYCKLAYQQHTRKNKIFSNRELHDLRAIISETDICSLHRLKNFLSKAGVQYPVFWDEYYFEPITETKQTNTKTVMYDVEVLDNKHALVADGIIVHNSHKLPIVEAEKMDFISTQQSNKDMEYGKYQEFLIKIACAVYKIDPAEIGFSMNGSSESKPLFEKGNEASLKYSKDKGLRPLLRFVESQINKYLISTTYPGYEFVYAGLDIESTKDELDNDLKAVQNWSTVNEIRRKRGMKDVENGDIILSPVLLQAKQQEMMQQQQVPEESEFEEEGGGEEEPESPFVKSLQKYLQEL